MMTVKAVSQRTGVSIRALQYYDRIGLLKATAYTQSGYRLYDDTALEQLQQILLFRELGFPLKDIQRILSSPDYDKSKAIAQQIELLELQKEHIENLIAFAKEIKSMGGSDMNFSAFDRKKLDAYTRQAKAAWGETEAWQSFEEKSQNRSEAAEEELAKGLMAIFAEMGQICQQAPDCEAAQSMVTKLQNYITAHYYPCTKQILAGLGQMYAADDEFTQNIDAAGGNGTAVFAGAAIRFYCT